MAFDPGSVPDDQGSQGHTNVDGVFVFLAEVLHVQHQVGQFGQVLVLGGAGHVGVPQLVPGGGVGGDPDRAHRVVGGGTHVHGDAVSDRELGVEPVGHGQVALFLPVPLVTAGEILWTWHEHGCGAVGGGQGEFGLEEPQVLFLALALLGVDEEDGDQSPAFVGTDPPTEDHPGLLGVEFDRTQVGVLLR